MSRQVARRRARNQLVHQKTRKNEREIELQTACRGYSANRRVFGNLHERQSDRRGGRGVPQRAPERFEVIPTAEKDAEAPKAGGESSELEAAHNRIAILESEKVELESRCAALQARIDAAAATDDEKPENESGEAESADEADEQPAGYNGNTADDAIRQAIAAELVAGKSKTAIKQELAGKEIGGVKLTHRLISDYIEKITAEE